MRIIFVTPYLSNGGAEREVAAFANNLVNMGNEVHIVCLWGGKADYPVDEKVVIHTWSINPAVKNRMLQGAYRLAVWGKKLTSLKGDIIIPFCLTPEYVLSFLPWLLFSRTKLLYTVRNNQQTTLSKRNQRLGRLTFSLVAGIWMQTEDQRKFFSKKIQKKTFVVPNILNNRFLDIRKPYRNNISELISVGRIHPQKNQKMLIQAFAKMIERTGNQEATLSIYGKVLEEDRATEAELKTLIRENHLEERVFLPGRVNDIETKYAQADMFVFGSDYEGCPNALMEAMAAGLPCISTDCPTGPSTIIESGKNGILVPVKDVDAMSHSMESLIQNPQWANQLGMAAKQRMKKWGGEKELAQELLTRLKEICP